MDINNEYGCLSIHESLLSLLKEFHTFCVDNDIKYSISWGTALGAIRHKGFIPWDDDIDVNITHQQYYKLRESIKLSNTLMLEEETDNVGWIPRITSKNRIKVNGYFPTIDLFFIDNIPNNFMARKIHVFEMLMLQGMLKRCLVWNKGNIVMKLGNLAAFLFGRLFTQKFKYRWFHWAMSRYNNKTTAKTASYNVEYIDMFKCYEGGLLNEIILVPFEDTSVYIAKNYHQFLIDMFGSNYMIPPVKKLPKHID